jgi:aminoglycoside phosphotransferase (APT) family kinase protein
VPAPDPDLLARAMARSLGQPVRVDGLRRLSGGASRETWAFDAVDDAGRVHPLVLRRDPGAHTGQSDRSTEYALLEAAAGAGVPVPLVRRLLAPDDGLGSGFVMERVGGETIPRKILRDNAFANARPKLAAQSGEVAAAIHAIDVRALPRLPVLDVDAQLAQQRDLLDGFGEPHPAFELALQWLARNAPEERAEPRLVHGDYRNGNFIVGPDGLRAVLDWELAHLGDPVEDLGWLCVKSWRFGIPDRIVGGFGDVGPLLDAYERVSGTRVDEERLRFWVVLGTLKWGVICIAQAFTHLNGIVRSVELATLGRRVCEMEWDVLELLQGGW